MCIKTLLKLEPSIKTLGATFLCMILRDFESNPFFLNSESVLGAGKNTEPSCTRRKYHADFDKTTGIVCSKNPYNLTGSEIRSYQGFIVHTLRFACKIKNYEYGGSRELVKTLNKY